MICSESCNLQSDGTLFRSRHPKNASETLCVGSAVRAIPFLNVLAFGRCSSRRVLAWMGEALLDHTQPPAPTPTKYFPVLEK